MSISGEAKFRIDAEHVRLLTEYLDFRKTELVRVFALLRNEKQALSFCKKLKAIVGMTRTRNQDHHQSSKALIAAVTAIAKSVCDKKGVSFNSNPQTRCVWCIENGLHVTARNLDGAIPALSNPFVIWEIKEYWGVTSGGSKMSDAVYETNLVGSELREFEEHSGISVQHIVFLDGQAQWSARKSDLLRFVDLMHQGIVDYLFVGKEVETEWQKTLTALLDQKL